MEGDLNRSREQHAALVASYRELNDDYQRLVGQQKPTIATMIGAEPDPPPTGALPPPEDVKQSPEYVKLQD